MTDASSAALEAVFGKPDDGMFSGTVVNERSARVKYWRKTDGWITTGPDVGTDAPKYQQYIQFKRYLELPNDFGLEVLGKGSITARHGKGREHAWLEKFIANGGLTYQLLPTDTFRLPNEQPGSYLMPKEQIVALNLHRRPGIVDLRPDLADAIDLECPYACVDESGRNRRLFSGVTREQAQASVDQHIVSVHKDAVASRAVGDTIAQQMKSLQGATVNPEMIATIAAAVVQALSSQDKGAIAATVQANNPAPVSYGSGDDLDVSFAANNTPPSVPDNAGINAPDIDKMNRGELMKFAKDAGLGMPEGGFSLKEAEWRDFVRAGLLNKVAGSSPS